MIEGNKLVYAAWDSVLKRWEIRNPVLNGVIIGILTTILSYQAAAVIFDISLGVKPRRVALVSDLQTLLLVHQSSPLAVAETVSRNDLLTRRRFVLEQGSRSPISRNPGKIKKRVSLKLLLLLVVAPFVNIAAIILTFETSRDLSFREAQFGGLGLGVNENSIVLEDTSPVTKTCELVPVKLARGEELLTRFLLCKIFSEGTKRVPLKEDEAEVVFLLTSTARLNVQVALSSPVASVSVTIYMQQQNGSLFVLPAVITNETSLALVNNAMHLLAGECKMPMASGAVNVTEAYINERLDGEPHPVLVKRMTCNTPPLSTEDALGNVIRDIAKQVTFVNSDSLLVGNYEDFKDAIFTDSITLSSAEDLKLLKRRRKNLSLFSLVILTASVVAVRVLTAVFFHNDIDMGLEMIMKRRFKFGCCDSVLWHAGSTVNYNARGAPGKVSYNDDESGGDEFEQELEDAIGRRNNQLAGSEG